MKDGQNVRDLVERTSQSEQDIGNDRQGPDIALFEICHFDRGQGIHVFDLLFVVVLEIGE